MVVELIASTRTVLGGPSGTGGEDGEGDGLLEQTHASHPGYNMNASHFYERQKTSALNSLTYI